ncbi:MAG TPA: VOC family protein [Candidatus Bathyarchaeia archaeon]|nr:VOC family protein [Candidatus Bathyarchaeia archaeon]
MSGLVLDLITLIVKNTRRSKEFYVKKLGFKLKTDAGEFVSVLTPNRFPIGLHTPHKGHKHKVAPDSFQLEFDVDDVDLWYERLKKRGVRFTQKPRDMPWKEREAELRDPDGHILVISSSRVMDK